MRLGDDSDLAWERYGRDDPYYGVLSAERFRRDRLTEDARTEFFATGRDHIERVAGDVERAFGGYGKRRRALDFGCGVGRCVIPLAASFDEVTGADVSPSMLAEARRNCAERGLANAAFVVADDALSAIGPGLDLAHSCLVLQHIERRRGLRILARLIELLSPGGIIALQFFAHSPAPAWRRAASAARTRFLPLNWLVNLARFQRWDEPLMQMHAYPLGDVARLAESGGVAEIHCRLDPGGSVLLIGRKAG